MAAYIGSYGTQAFGTEENSKPNSVIMLYTGHNDYNHQGEPATKAANPVAQMQTRRKRR